MRSRARKSAAAGVLVTAVLAAGVAFAAFVSDNPYTGNTATGGSLNVTTSGLPLKFADGSALYPTKDCTNPDDGTVETSSFTITNGNPVKVAYTVLAASESQNDPQYKNLCIKISTTTPGTKTQTVPGSPTALPGDSSTAPQTDVLYNGPLSGLDGSKTDLLGVLTKGQQQTYDVTLSLQDDGTVQSQGQQSPFTLTVRATTPSDAHPTTTTTTESTTTTTAASQP